MEKVQTRGTSVVKKTRSIVGIECAIINTLIPKKEKDFLAERIKNLGGTFVESFDSTKTVKIDNKISDEVLKRLISSGTKFLYFKPGRGPELLMENYSGI